MYIDKDKNGKFSIMELSPEQLRLILLACEDRGIPELRELQKMIGYEIHAGRH